jgi:hypothetical protein
MHCDDRDAARERHGLTADDGAERVRPYYAVAAQVEPVLQDPDTVQRRAVVVRVDRDVDSLPDE